jgi:hypothetical protein
MGRPTEFSNAEIDRLCQRLERGELLTHICREEGMPAVRTVYQWLESRPEAKAAIDAARKIGYQRIAEDALEIANTPVVGEIETVAPDGTTIRREDALGHRKLQVETRLKLLRHWWPERYGERMQLAGDKDAPLTVQVVALTPKSGDDST